MASDTAKIIAQLNTLLRLTHTEILIAETRRTQAGSEAIERELAENADEGRGRVELITAAIRELGGVPDLMGVAAGRFTALAKTQVEQPQELSEALFGDLALEQQLVARARFLRVLADTAGNGELRRVAERLEKAHIETVEWLEIRLAEIAVGGPPAIRPTPVQWATGVARRTASFPLRTAATTVNRSLRTLQSARGVAEAAVSEQLDRAGDLVEAAESVYAAGRDASLQQAETEARREGATGTAADIRSTRARVGALDVDELPIDDYDELNATTVREQLRTLTEPGDVRAVLRYEERNARRSTVVNEAQARLGTLARAELDGEEPATEEPAGRTRTTKAAELEELSVEELRERAQEADVEGRSSMNKKELVNALKA